jgi:DNA-binding CsgD family transcriptional regulator
MDETDFTPRQRQVLLELCKGKSNKEIARVLGMAEATVKLHLTEIFKTMGVRTRYQALTKAVDFAVTVADKPKKLTDFEILEEFTDLAFTVQEDKWSKRVLKFGRALLNKEGK